MYLEPFPEAPLLSRRRRPGAALRLDTAEAGGGGGHGESAERCCGRDTWEAADYLERAEATNCVLPSEASQVCVCVSPGDSRMALYVHEY